MAGPAAHTITVPVRFVSQVRAIVFVQLIAAATGRPAVPSAHRSG